jgi:hypothetical protein
LLLSGGTIPGGNRYGDIWSIATCDAGSYKATNYDSSSCITCAIGSYSHQGATTCIACNTMISNPSFGATTCYSCSYNTTTGRPIGLCTCRPGYVNQTSTTTVQGYSCQQCAVGRYRSNEMTIAGINECRVCPLSGYDCSGSATLTPLICPVGYYCPSSSLPPLSCGNNKYRTSPLGSNSSTNCQCQPGYVGSNGASLPCNVCSSGYYCSGGESQVICPAGYYCPSGGATQLSCPPNYYCPIGSSQPLSCGTKRISAMNSGATNDCQCIAGYVGVNNASAVCSSCVAGYYCNGGESQTICPSSYYCPSGSGTPITCGKYRTSIAGSINATACNCLSGYLGTPQRANDTCTPCSAGYYCPTSFAINQRICLASYYCPAASTAPLSCGNNRTTNNIGSASSSDCKCISGYVGSDGASLTCELCPSGYYCSGSTSQVICPLSYYCPAGSDVPISCGNNQTTLSTASTSSNDCICVAGYYYNDRSMQANRCTCKVTHSSFLRLSHQFL